MWTHSICSFVGSIPQHAASVAHVPVRPGGTAASGGGETVIVMHGLWQFACSHVESGAAAAVHVGLTMLEQLSSQVALPVPHAHSHDSRAAHADSVLVNAAPHDDSRHVAHAWFAMSSRCTHDSASGERPPVSLPKGDAESTGELPASPPPPHHRPLRGQGPRHMPVARWRAL